MRKADIIPTKIFTRPEAVKRILQWKIVDKTVAFTNGCFDLLHAGHVTYLQQAAALGDVLIVAMNDVNTVGAPSYTSGVQK